MKKRPLKLMIFAIFALIGYVFPAGQTVELIQNPAELHFGEIALDLEADLILGSESDDNHLFYRVWDVQADDRGNLYVLDSGTTRIPFFYMALAADGEGHFIVTGRITVEGAQNLGVLILDSDGNTWKKIAEFPGLPLHETGMTISHGCSPEIRFAAIKNEGIVYGYNLDYKLYIADWSGKNIIVFEKEEPVHPVTQKEKSKILDDLAKNTMKAGLGWSKSRRSISSEETVITCTPQSFLLFP